MPVATPIEAVAVLWILWMLSWLAAAAWSAPTVVRRPLGERVVYTALIAVGIVLLFNPSVIVRHQPRLLPLAAAVAWAAVVVVALGIAFAWWARVHLGRLWSGEVTLKAGHTLVTSGPYGLTRHPIYTGLLLALLATAVVRDQPTALLGLVLIVFAARLKVAQEERLLSGHFGEAYERYRRRVPALLPGPWRRNAAADRRR